MCFSSELLTSLSSHCTQLTRYTTQVQFSTAPFHVSVWKPCMCVHLCGSGVIACLYGPGYCTNSLLNYHEERSIIGSLTKHVYETMLLKIPRIRGRGSWSIVVSVASLFSYLSRNYFLYKLIFHQLLYCICRCARAKSYITISILTLSWYSTA